jgi:2-dehydro-3-deoxyphosphooctonate aldolase (KDO 8-P synthase)
VFREIRETLGLPVVTDVHEAGQCARRRGGGRAADPGLPCADGPAHCGRQDGRAVVKKGQFLAPWDMANVVAKITGGSNPTCW